MKLNDNVLGNLEYAGTVLCFAGGAALAYDGHRRKKSYKDRSEAMDNSINTAAESVASDMNPEDLVDDDEEEADEQPAPEENDSEDAE